MTDTRDRDETVQSISVTLETRWRYENNQQVLQFRCAVPKYFTDLGNFILGWSEWEDVPKAY